MNKTDKILPFYNLYSSREIENKQINKCTKRLRGERRDRGCYFRKKGQGLFEVIILKKKFHRNEGVDTQEKSKLGKGNSKWRALRQSSIFTMFKEQ